MSRYIDADVLLKRVEELVGDNEWYENLFCADSVCGLVEEAPTIDAVPVVYGHWIKNIFESEKHSEPIYYCSNCENFEAWGETEKYNYCPNCGAKMDEVTDDDS